MKSVTELWKELMVCYQEQGYGTLRTITTLHKPINETEYRDLQKAIGPNHTIPKDYLELLKIHNGSGKDKYGLEDFSFVLYHFMSSTRAIASMHQFQAAYREGWFGYGDRTPNRVGGVQSVFWDNLWLPIFYSEDNIFICIDFNPDSGGKVGQVIKIDLKRGPQQRWDSFLAFFQKQVEEIVNNPDDLILLSDADEKAFAEIEKQKSQSKMPEIKHEKKPGWLSWGKPKETK